MCRFFNYTFGHWINFGSVYLYTLVCHESPCSLQTITQKGRTSFHNITRNPFSRILYDRWNMNTKKSLLLPVRYIYLYIHTNTELVENRNWPLAASSSPNLELLSCTWCENAHYTIVKRWCWCRAHIALCALCIIYTERRRVHPFSHIFPWEIESRCA